MALHKIDIERAVRAKSLVGDPLVAPSGSNYSEGTVVDHFCLMCGGTLASHDHGDDCDRKLLTTRYPFVPEWFWRMINKEEYR